MWGDEASTIGIKTLEILKIPGVYLLSGFGLPDHRLFQVP